ncbi:AraC family transcriptional regulator [Vibrio penaeicida]|uniref:AraC family transcriptional regulator n=1 Tax=Vibrio penaeicida TaxID=104609 RepID=A0AAV5P091_9VIBR|nr:AraC family transcriptional regulator [Vibrio penaeicida]RTZ22746.1 AraC family transcriptional regulator [Vibrio penaeicida]GLQ76179.1 AraC family transcriptional regulator [Vibrio penaeicida]
MKNNNGLNGPKPAQVMTLPSEMNNHDHEYTQIVIGLNGQAEFDVAGVGNFIGPGQGCVVTASSQHAFGGIGKSDILVLNMPMMSEYDPLVLQKLNELGKKDIYFQLDNQIQQLIAMLVSEMRNSPADELLSRACNDTVIALLQRHLKSFQALQKDGRLDMDAVDRYIEQHLSHRITVTQLAGSVFLGESQFHMLFKEQTGVTPHQYVLGRRVDMAKKLIEQGNLSLGHIAELTGFSGQSTFTHTFSRLQGISPSVYKKRLLNKH